MVCAEGAGLSKRQGADGFWELEHSEGPCTSTISVAITKYLRLSSLQRKGLQTKIRQMHTLMTPHIQSQREAERKQSCGEVARCMPWSHSQEKISNPCPGHRSCCLIALPWELSRKVPNCTTLCIASPAQEPLREHPDHRAAIFRELRF